MAQCGCSQRTRLALNLEQQQGGGDGGESQSILQKKDSEEEERRPRIFSRRTDQFLTF